MEEVSSEVLSKEVQKKLWKKKWEECNISRSGENHVRKLIDSDEVESEEVTCL